ncbi:MAG: type II toxin-antitoxin system RelE/ParE family toxin [Gammaproteobacteria bacterium]|jgi:mRNA interferase RelE/StbE
MHAVKQLKKLDKTEQKNIINFLNKKISGCSNPRYLGKPLKGKLSGLWRYRLRDYRIICKIQDDEVTVLVLNIKHRKNVYR